MEAVQSIAVSSLNGSILSDLLLKQEEIVVSSDINVYLGSDDTRKIVDEYQNQRSVKDRDLWYIRVCVKGSVREHVQN